MLPAFELHASLAARVRVGLLAIEGVSVREADAWLAAEVDAACAELRGRFGEARSSEVPGTADARTLYKALGIDPTKTRPSNEALLRRALKGESLYRINTLVDALNLVSLREQLPFGLYDLERVRAPVALRLGGPGESYEGIRKGRVNVEGRPVLVDAEGPFGNPTSDSLRTSITLATTRCLVVAYAPAGFPPERSRRPAAESRSAAGRRRKPASARPPRGPQSAARACKMRS
jgi:DNA/RNA-binding domain of Phe-tRNA-synthetase-like protein